VYYRKVQRFTAFIVVNELKRKHNNNINYHTHERPYKEKGKRIKN